MAAAQTWVRKALDVSQLPRVRLNNIQDLPGAKRKVCVDTNLYIAGFKYTHWRSKSLHVAH